MDDGKVPTMLGNEGPEWLVISGPRYRVSGSATFQKDYYVEEYYPEQAEEEINRLKATRLERGLTPAEAARRYHVDRTIIIELEERNEKLSILDWLRLYGLYEQTLSVTYIKEGTTEKEKNYITLFNVLLQEAESVYEAAMKTRTHYINEERKSAQKKRRMKEKHTTTYQI